MFWLIKLIRYRFMLIAGFFPYCLGAAIAFYLKEQFNPFFFMVGLIGLLFVLIGVEAFNEFFDWVMGTDRVFLLDPKPVTIRVFLVGSVAFVGALIVAIFLTSQLGLTIIILSVIGFFAAFFYLGPPLKLAYRGLGEMTIAFSYGPLMLLGSYYLQTQRVDFIPLFVSLIPALLLFGISILNEVPDFFQDRIVGKRNICVRIGQRKTVRLYGGVLILFYIISLAGLFSGNLPRLAWLVLICLPISWLSYTIGTQVFNNAHRFVAPIRYSLIQYVIVLTILIVGYTL